MENIHLTIYKLTFDSKKLTLYDGKQTLDNKKLTFDKQNENHKAYNILLAIAQDRLS